MPDHSLGYLLSASGIGAAVGFMSGLLGKGGSAVTTPALRIVLATPQFAALASPLPAALPSTISASFAYRGRGLVDRQALLTTCVIGFPATILGALASHLLGGHALMLLTALLVSGIGLSILMSHERLQMPETLPGATYRWRLGLIGLGVGFVAGLLANTGGVLYAPLFMQWARMETRRALATSLVVSAILAIPGTVAHAALGHIDWSLALALSVGGIPGSYLGARFALSLHNDVLLRVYGLALVAIGFYDLAYTERDALARLFGLG